MQNRIVALENEEKAKKKIIQELDGEKHSLLKIQKEQKKAMDVMVNEKELKKKRDQLKEELRNKKNELKEKQNLLRKQEKQMKEQHENLIVMEEKSRKLQTLVYEKKAGLSSNETEVKTEDDIKTLETSIKELENVQNEEKKKYKQMITTQENKIKELTLQIETLNLELKQKDQECRLNSLKISELKRQIRMTNAKPAEQAPLANKPGVSRVCKDVEQIKRDMRAEKEQSNSDATPGRVMSEVDREGYEQDIKAPSTQQQPIHQVKDTIVKEPELKKEPEAIVPDTKKEPDIVKPEPKVEQKKEPEVKKTVETKKEAEQKETKKQPEPKRETPEVKAEEPAQAPAK